MSVLRRLALVVLILAVLPWGAYAQGWGGAGTPVALGGKVVGPDDDGAAPKFLGKPKRCRTAMLLGAACGPDMALVALPLFAEPILALVRFLPDRGHRGRHQVPEGALDPPRLG
jgi:hypothetical protein